MPTPTLEEVLLGFRPWTLAEVNENDPNQNILHMAGHPAGRVGFGSGTAETYAKQAGNRRAARLGRVIGVGRAPRGNVRMARSMAKADRRLNRSEAKAGRRLNRSEGKARRRAARAAWKRRTSRKNK